MSDTTFTDFNTATGSGTVIVSTWLNDVNITTYRALGTGGVAPTTPAAVVTNLTAAVTSTWNMTAQYSNNMSGGALGSIPYQSALNTSLFLAGITSTTPSFLTSTGTGATTQAPTWTSSTGSGAVVLSASPTLTGTPLAPSAASGTNTTQLSTTAFVNTEIGATYPNFTAAVATNALTGTLTAPLVTEFRNATLGTGGFTQSIISGNLTLTVPSGATLGTVSTVAARLVWLLAYNGGTPVLCVVNLSGGNQLDETNLISPTTISGASNSANVIYSAATVSANSPYRVVGFIDITEATAGTWATAPSTVQGVGGQALTALSSMGYGQTWAASGKVVGTTYYNTKGKPITAFINALSSASPTTLTATINGLAFTTSYFSGVGYICGGTFIIPPGGSIVVGITNGTLNQWHELS